MSRASDFEDIPAARAQAIIGFMSSRSPFANHLGIRFEEVRLEYGRATLPFRTEYNQPAGMVHGGAIASLIDTVVVLPLLSALDDPPRKLLTIDLHIHYFDAAVEEDLVAEGWVKRRGRSTAFVAAEVRTASGKLVAEGNMAYRIVP